jgi:hypothetical protein
MAQKLLEKLVSKQPNITLLSNEGGLKLFSKMVHGANTGILYKI